MCSTIYNIKKLGIFIMYDGGIKMRTTIDISEDLLEEVFLYNQK